MKKYVLIMLVILALSFSTMVSADGLDGSTYSLENILTFPVVEIQAVTAQDFGGVAVLSVNFSEQVVISNIYTLSVVPVNEQVLSSFPISLERQISKGWSIYLAVES